MSLGKLRLYQTTTVQDETWVNTQGEWMRKRVENERPGAWLIDLKRIDPSKQFDPDAPEYDPHQTILSRVGADEDLMARNKALVRDFYNTVLIGRDVDAAPGFLRPDYIQHNPQVPTGLKGFMETFRARFAQPLPPDYKRELLSVIGENDMVVIYVRQTWTSRDGQHHQALGFDMFRVQNGKIAEHWDAD